MTNSSKNRAFIISLLLGLMICVALYLTEAIHFLHYGWQNETYATPKNHAQCKSVNGTSNELDCPVNGYGFARFHITSKNHHFVYKDPLE
jgi:hypothetical protein